MPLLEPPAVEPPSPGEAGPDQPAAGVPPPRPPFGYAIAACLFTRVMGAIYLVAFASLAVQVLGLAGRNGILPAQPYLDAIETHIGLERLWRLPTIFWWTGASDATLQTACWAGAAAGLLVALGVLPRLGLALAFVLYLSLASVCRTFLNFQWDALLLETGLLAIFVAPGRLRCRVPCARPPRLALWLVWWLLFRLMFSSGVVKLSSGDPTWWNLRALDVHYFTQPIPTWTAWYAQQMPRWFQTFSCGLMFVIELAVPFGIFGPKPVRRVAGAALLAFQVLIASTGNYAYFNWLTMALCLTLFDDAVWPRRWRDRAAMLEEEERARGLPWGLVLGVPFAAALVVVTTFEMTRRFGLGSLWPAPFHETAEFAQPFRVANAYGLFAAMTTTRGEIVVEGSDDGQTWKPYAFRYKPGDLDRHPVFVAPHQPRLDWQMWFAALSSYRSQGWFQSFLVRLLQGSPDVLALLETNPFPAAPPRYVRATMYDYRFTDFATRRATGAWWARTETGPYAPPMSLRPETAR